MGEAKLWVRSATLEGNRCPFILEVQIMPGVSFAVGHVRAS